MQVPQLRINQTHGQIGMNHHRPHLDIKQHNADLSIKQEHVATLQISQKAAKLSIDQSEAFADANLKGPLRSSNEFIAKTKQNVMQFIAKKSREGDQMMKIENGGGVIASIAAQNSHLYPPLDFNYDTMPKPMRVNIQFQPNDVDIRVNRIEPDIQVTKNDPTIQHRPWQIDTYMTQKQSISFQAVGLEVNRQL